MENNKYKVYAFLALIGTLVLGIGSSMYTFELFRDFGTGFYSWVSGFIGLAFDLGKYLFAAGMVYQFNKNKFGSSFGLLVLTIICIVISFGASQARDLNIKNNIENEAIEAITESKEYKRNEQLFDGTAEEKENLEKELKDLKANKETKIKESSQGLREIKNSLPANYITKRTTTQKNIDKKEAETRKNIESRIAEIENKLEGKNNNLNKLNQNFEKTKVKTTKGAYALAEYIAGEEGSPEETFGTMVAWKNALQEVIGIAFSLLFGLFLGKSGVDIAGKLKEKWNQVKEKIEDSKEPETVESNNEIPDLEKKK